MVPMSRTGGMRCSFTGSLGEQTRRQRRQRRVLRAADRDLAFQRHAALNPKLVHT